MRRVAPKAKLHDLESFCTPHSNAVLVMLSHVRATLNSMKIKNSIDPRIGALCLKSEVAI
jgi:hypothetical protein